MEQEYKQKQNRQKISDSKRKQAHTKQNNGKDGLKNKQTSIKSKPMKKEEILPQRRLSSHVVHL